MPNKQQDSVYAEPKDIYNKKIQSKPVPEKQIGIDTRNSFYQDIIESSAHSALDISAFTNFDQASQSRDSIYALIDTMCQDSTISSVLETYVEDAIETNDLGQVVWAESSNADIARYVNYLLDAMRVDKHAGQWMHSLCKYGDLYLRIYRESEYDDGLFDKDSATPSKLLREDIDLSDSDIDIPQEKLEEQVNLKAYSRDDHFVHYLEMQADPAQVFELTKFGKSYAYIKTHSPSTSSASAYNPGSVYSYKYQFNRGDIDVYAATEFVHGCIEGESSRTPEEVSITLNSDKNISYQVRRGQPLFYNSFKVWRELLLLKNSVLLNRVTRSSLVRAIQVEVGDMPKEQVGPHLQGIKRLFEQSQALVAGKGMSEYTNPGPIENNVYIPTRGGKGAISIQQVGGDGSVSSGQLADLDYYTRVLFGSLGVPKEYFGFTDDNAGFSGGDSLAQISAGYAKKIRRIQSVFTQTLTDAINIILLDRGLGNYINKFNLKMQAPATKDETARREQLANRVTLTDSIMSTLGDIQEPAARLKILKALYSEYITNAEVIELIQKEIDKLEAEVEGATSSEDDVSTSGEANAYEEPDADMSGGSEDSGLDILDALGGGSRSADQEAPEAVEPTAEYETDMDTDTLPAPNQLGIDFTDSSNFTD